MIELSLADELALLAYDDESGTNKLGQPALDYGLAGALLMELALAGRVELVDKRVSVLDAGPTGHPVVDDALRRIADDGKQHKPKHWVNKLSKGLRARVLDHLAGARVLRREADKVFGIFPRTRYPAADGAAEAEVRQRLRSVITGSGAAEPRTAALCALVQATRFDRKVFRDLPRGQVKTRLKEISEGSWAAAAVRKAVEEVQAATAVAVTAAVAAGDGGGGA